MNIIRFYKWFLIDQFMLSCGGGGGGGDGGAQERADTEKKRIADATQQINAIFGMTDQGLYPDIQTRVDTPVTNSGDGEGGSWNTPSFNTTYTTSKNPLYDTATKNKAAIDASLSSTRENILKYFKNQLNQQSDVANRDVSQRLAQAGLTGGSHQIDTNADLSRTYNDALLGYTNTADTSVNNLKSSDEQARSNLISQITSGADQASAVAAANSALANNAALASSSATQGGIGNVFGNFGSLYNTSQDTAAKNAAWNRVSTALGLNPGSYSGSLVRG